MENKTLEELSDEALLQQAKQLKPTKLYDALIIGFLIGVAIFSSVRNGMGLLTFLPLIYLPVASKNRKKVEAVNKLLQERGLDVS
ncbi:MAG: FUSC family protein [Phaeodactylibacter sp.]|nr:FUSC family protein [Phaeodactylibacter sp.]